ncbi:DUF6220 domain-containing protein [Cohnella sp. REN36]|uniref:DUF6220 domain-containing protein n=1 Tax=Cohnella sp. REN36 TaxID=2887347 RepID=UPI001D14429C|nr:DUF6220 domain-containing protein [Cohnella sp. REN36]MCC3375432.1 DUF6220 domain-containing protein [Cohnella sp. REN36]
MEQRNKSHRNYAHLIYSVLAWLFAACIVIQLFFAGLGMFTDSKFWEYHSNFVHFFEFILLLLVIIAFIGKLSHGLRWWPFGLFAMIALQYLTAEMTLGTTAAALHPVIATFLFYGSVNVAVRATRTLK